MGWGSSSRRGISQELRALPRKFVFLGFRREESGILPGCPGPLGVFKKFVQKSFVCAELSENARTDSTTTRDRNLRVWGAVSADLLVSRQIRTPTPGILPGCPERLTFSKFGSGDRLVGSGKGWWPKSSCPSSKVCLPWVSKRGIWDVLGILPGCPGPLGVFKKFVLKKFVRIFRSLLQGNTRLVHTQSEELCAPSASA